MNLFSSLLFREEGYSNFSTGLEIASMHEHEERNDIFFAKAQNKSYDVLGLAVCHCLLSCCLVTNVCDIECCFLLKGQSAVENRKKRENPFLGALSKNVSELPLLQNTKEADHG